MRFSGLRDPENPPKRYFGHKKGYRGRVFALKNLFRGFARCWTVWEGSQAVTDQSGTPLGGGTPWPGWALNFFEKKFENFF